MVRLSLQQGGANDDGANETNESESPDGEEEDADAPEPDWDALIAFDETARDKIEAFNN